jgi:hypothetical protein
MGKASCVEAGAMKAMLYVGGRTSVLLLDLSRIRYQARSQNFEKATINFVMSVCPSARNNSAHNGRIFKKFDI